MQLKPKRSKVPLVIGIVIALAVIATVGIAFALASSPSCKSAACTAASSSSTKKPTGTHKATPPSPTANPTPNTTPTEPATVPTLASVMPTDIDVNNDDSCETDLDSDLANTTSFYYCEEPHDFDLPNLTLSAYQFTSAGTLAAGLKSLNSEVKFKAHSTAVCPNAAGAAGVWGLESGPTLGTLECYVDTKNHVNYVWTDSAELTLMVATCPDSFSDLSKWWENNNGNGQGD